MSVTADVEQATVVHIAVSGTHGKKKAYEIAVFPQRVNDVTLFFTPEGKRAKQCAEKPRQVLWVAHGIEEGQKIRITAKNPGSGLLSDQYELTARNPVVPSGPVMRAPAQVHGDAWPYSVKLLGISNEQLAFVDPDVIIKNDP